MDPKRELYIKRLRHGLEANESFHKNRTQAHDPDFQSWKDGVSQSLGKLFGSEHDYTRRFRRLTFWKTRISFGSGSGWSLRDQKKFENDLQLAREILNEALEELAVVPTKCQPTQIKTKSEPASPIVINVTNILSQTFHVEVDQLMAGLDSLDLTVDERKQVEIHARELEQETRGAQRWPVLAKTLASLQAAGKSIYEKIAIPLLLEMLKRQAGLGD